MHKWPNLTYSDYYSGEESDYDPAEYGASIATEKPSNETQGSIFDLLGDYLDDYDFEYEGDEAQKEELKSAMEKDPEQMTVNDVLEYIDELMQNVPLDREEYYDYLENSSLRRPKRKTW